MMPTIENSDVTKTRHVHERSSTLDSLTSCKSSGSRMSYKLEASEACSNAPGSGPSS